MDPLVLAIVFVVAALVVVVFARRRPGGETGTKRDTAAPEKAATPVDVAAREDEAGREDEAARERAAAEDDDDPTVTEEPHTSTDRDDEPAIVPSEDGSAGGTPDEPDSRPDDDAAPARASTASPAACPKCGSEMVERVAKRGPRAGRTFLACKRYPTCRTAFEIEASGNSRA